MIQSGLKSIFKQNQSCAGELWWKRAVYTSLELVLEYGPEKQCSAQ